MICKKCGIDIPGAHTSDGLCGKCAHSSITESKGDFFDPCDFCPWFSVTKKGLRIHFGMVHAKAQCADNEHEYDNTGFCIKKNCGMRKEWATI